MTPPSTFSSVWTLATVTFTRLTRGKALWIGGLIACLPIIYAQAVAASGHVSPPDELFMFLRPLLALFPAMFVGASVGEELEDRTASYLWSRPLPRWAVVAGKLLALAPFVIALLVGAWVIAVLSATKQPPTAASCAAIAAGALAASVVAAGVATCVPKHSTALPIGYLLVDNFLGVLPLSVSKISISAQTRVLAGMADGSLVTAAISLAAITAVWAAIALLRIRKLEI